MRYAFDYSDTDKHTVATATYYNQTPTPRHSGPPARLQCPFNNVPCMRGCVERSQCQLVVAHDNTPAPFDTLAIAKALSLTPHWKPPQPRRDPPPPARYDGSIDDWDVDDFTPPPPPTPSPRRRIEAILARFGWQWFNRPSKADVARERWMLRTLELQEEEARRRSGLRYNPDYMV